MSAAHSNHWPLRAVVDHYEENGMHKERLDCGHVIGRKLDAFGYTTAVRRRCRYCMNERIARAEARL